MDDRTFGVELEFNTNKQGGTDFVRGVWKKALGETSRWCSAPIGRDGSQLEVRGPVLKGADDMEELKAAVQALADNGCKVNRADGLHVHHGAKEFKTDTKLLLKAYQSWYNNQKLINRFVAPRRVNSFVCKDVTVKCVNYVAEGFTGFDRYHSFNVAPLNKPSQTIEFRQHEGTLRPEYVEAWIEFGKAFLNKAMHSEEPMRAYRMPHTLLRALEVPTPIKDVLLEKVKNRPEREPVATGDDFYYPKPGGWI